MLHSALGSPCTPHRICPGFFLHLSQAGEPCLWGVSVLWLSSDSPRGQFPSRKKRSCLCLVAQSCLTLCSSMDYSPRGSSVHGILQARILEWIAISFSQGIFPTQGSNPHLLHLAGGFFTAEPLEMPMPYIYVYVGIHICTQAYFKTLLIFFKN